MMTAEEFIARIDKFLTVSGMTPTAFGRSAVNDPNLVGDLRAGRMPNLRTLQRITEFMEREKPAVTGQGQAA